MNLFVLRHAIAADLGASGLEADRERPLTEAGRAKLAKVGRALSRLKLRFSVILTSPYRRARQTADALAGQLGLGARVRDCEHLIPGARPASLVRYLAKLRPQPRDVLLVGHEPHLSELVGLLLAGATPLSLEFKKAGLCKLSVPRLQPARCATLEWFLPPKLMALMA